MDETSRISEHAEQGFWSWLGFWVQLVVLGVLAVIGAFFASTGIGPGDYACGLLLSLAAIAFAFLRLKHRLDGGASDRSSFLFVDDMKSLAVAIPLFTIIGFAGLLLAHAWEYGSSLHTAGIGLFVISSVIIFLDIKRVFDRIDRGRP